MSARWLSALEHVHGHLGWLAAAALVHPAILCRRPRRRALLAAALATGLATMAGALGAVLYPSYRADIKPALFAAAPAVGLAFERKEHLAIGALGLAWAGLAAHWAESRKPPGAPGPLARMAYVAYLGSATMACAAAVLGTLAASFRTF